MADTAADAARRHSAQRIKAAALADKAARSNGGGAKASASQGLSRDDLRALAQGLVPFLHELMAPLKARIAELEAKALTDGGVWKGERMYAVGSVVTHDSTIWVAKEPNSNAVPGKSDAWRMMARTKSHR